MYFEMVSFVEPQSEVMGATRLECGMEITLITLCTPA